MDVASLLGRHRYRVLARGEAFRAGDIDADRRELDIRCAPEGLGILRRTRLAGDVHRFLDQGEVVRDGDQWWDADGRWRPVWSAIGAVVVNERHLRRRLDDLVESIADIRPCTLVSVDRKRDEIRRELGVHSDAMSVIRFTAPSAVHLGGGDPGLTDDDGICLPNGSLLRGTVYRGLTCTTVDGIPVLDADGAPIERNIEALRRRRR